jgi:cytochrome c-type biogenesis protein CcmH
MKTILKFILIYAIPFFAHSAIANDEPVQFNNESQEHRYYDLIDEIRCLVCQNQSLADSNAELAQDLRKEVYEMIISGKQDEEIHQFLVERYGDFVLYRPPLKQNTWLLWFGPFLLLIIAVIFALIIIRKQSKANTIKTDISEEEQQRLDKILKENATKDEQ